MMNLKKAFMAATLLSIGVVTPLEARSTVRASDVATAQKMCDQDKTEFYLGSGKIYICRTKKVESTLDILKGWSRDDICHNLQINLEHALDFDTIKQVNPIDLKRYQHSLNVHKEMIKDLCTPLVS